MNSKSGDFKKLIRNLRTKKYEKLRFVRNNATIAQGEKSKNGKTGQP
jgi:hypothetical protein